jgi:hypothetical protein
MKKLMLSIVALAVLAGGALRAQDLTGNWQGTRRPMWKALLPPIR